MRILVMDGAATGAQAQALIACLSADAAGLPALLATRIATGRGAAEQFPLLATELFAQCGWGHAMPDLAGVVVGPGSFTGLRASLAFAHGLAAGAGCTVVGVTGGEVMAPALHAAAGALGATALHCTMARRGRVFIETPGTPSALGQVRACMLDALDLPPGPLLLAGNGAQAIMEAAGPRGDMHLLPDAPPDPQAIAAAALLRLHGRLPPCAAQPLYVDAPEARLPAAGLRPAPRYPMTDAAALTGQAALLARIHAAAFTPVHRWDAQAMATLLAMPGVFVLFAQGENVPLTAGFIMARALFDEAEILTFAVDPAWQGQGIGRDLLARCGNEAARAGAAHMFLEVADDNVAALGLYHAAGFAVVGVRRRYYSDGTDACVMTREI